MPGTTFADGELQPESDGRDDAGEFIVSMSERYDLPVSKTMDFMAEVMEELMPDSPQQSPNNSFSGAQCRVGIEQFARLMVQHRYNQALLNRVILWCMNSRALDDVINQEYPAVWARQFGLSRYAVSKMVTFVQTELNMPLRDEQKDSSAREKMKSKREAQLTPK